MPVEIPPARERGYKPGDVMKEKQVGKVKLQLIYVGNVDEQPK